MNLLEQRYKLPHDIVIKKRHGKYLFLSPSKPGWLVTNSNGALALKLCNGKRTLREIINVINRIANRDVSKEIHAYFQEIIVNSNLFPSNDTDSFCHLPNNLRMIHLSLTSQCNLRCIYCYASERATLKGNLSLKEVLNVIDSINNIAQNATIILTGGEPLLENHTFEVAEYANKRGNQVHLLTNGTLINEDNANRISQIFHLVQVSIDGSNAEIHDFHRGKGSFKKVTEATELLIKNGAFVQISMTVTRKNSHDIENMVKKFDSPLSFAPLFKAGRGKDRKDLAISGREYYEALSSVKGVNPLSYLCSSLERAKQRKILKCAMGDSEISISNTGDVYPCHLLHSPQFLAGNIREQSLESIYQTSETLKSYRDLTVLKIDGCNHCDIKFICGGACRARAFFEKNRIDVSDDFCEYEKQAFINGLFELHNFD